MTPVIHARLQAALADLPHYSRDNQWTHLRVDTTVGLVVLEWGPIHSNGFEECATVELNYIWTTDGKIKTVVHPRKS